VGSIVGRAETRSGDASTARRRFSKNVSVLDIEMVRWLWWTLMVASSDVLIDVSSADRNS
jgi:hypothetical protein